MTEQGVKRVTIGHAELWSGNNSLVTLPKDALLVSDPPYGINYQHNGTGNSLIRQDTRPIFGDDKPFDPAPWLGFPGVLLWGADHFRARLPEGGTFLAWDKSVGIGPADSFVDAEFAWVNSKIKRNVYRHLWKGINAWWKEEDVQGRFQRHHTSQKPLPLMRWCIEMLRPRPGAVIIDPFMGSGSTGVAAISLGMRFIGCEIDPQHFATACERIERAQREMGLLDPVTLDTTQ